MFSVYHIHPRQQNNKADRCSDAKMRFGKIRRQIADMPQCKHARAEIATVTAGLRAMGCDITPTDDGMIIRGGKTLHGAEIDSYLDHRIAMSFAVAALAADGVTSIKDADCVKISYPNFYDDLLGLAK